MTAVVLDASVTLARVLPDEDSDLVDAILDAAIEGSVELLVSPHWGLECWNGLLVAERRGRMTRESAEAARGELAIMPVTRLLDHAPTELIFELARHHELSIYDAAHLALALQEGAQLATGDRALAAAAREHGALWRK